MEQCGDHSSSEIDLGPEATDPQLLLRGPEPAARVADDRGLIWIGDTEAGLLHTHSSFHFQTSRRKASRPSWCRFRPCSRQSFFSTTTWVAMPAWSQPGFHRVVSPRMRCLWKEHGGPEVSGPVEPGTKGRRGFWVGSQWTRERKGWWRGTPNSKITVRGRRGTRTAKEEALVQLNNKTYQKVMIIKSSKL